MSDKHGGHVSGWKTAGSDPGFGSDIPPPPTPAPTPAHLSVSQGHGFSAWYPE